jgi:hypothetical protein
MVLVLIGVAHSKAVHLAKELLEVATDVEKLDSLLSLYGFLQPSVFLVGRRNL